MAAEAKQQILARIREANERAVRGKETPVPRDYVHSGGLDAASREELFIERLREYDASVTVCASAGLASTIGVLLQDRGWKHVIMAAGFPAAALPFGFEFRQEAEVENSDLDACDAVITGCEVAIAVTGSIVLRHGVGLGQGTRRFTLLPDRHLCVVRAEQLVETVPEAFALLEPFTNDPLTTISGPSATADIEMTRIRGVHGPRFLEVVLVR